MHLDDLTRKFSGTREDQGKAIFSTLFIAGNRLQTLFDSHIQELSLKQFMLLSIVRQSQEPLTFTQSGNLLGCSRQNIKKLADVLEKKGFITLRHQGHVHLPHRKSGRLFPERFFPVSGRAAVSL